MKLKFIEKYLLNKLTEVIILGDKKTSGKEFAIAMIRKI